MFTEASFEWASKSWVKRLSNDQCLLLNFLHGLTSGDLKRCTDLVSRTEISINRLYFLSKWLSEQFLFSLQEVADAFSTLASALSNGDLQLPITLAVTISSLITVHHLSEHFSSSEDWKAKSLVTVLIEYARVYTPGIECIKDFINVEDIQMNDSGIELNQKSETAIEGNNVSVVETLIKSIVNKKTFTGSTLFHQVVSKGNVDMVDALLKLGAKVNSLDNCGEMPLHIAASCSNDQTKDIISLLANHGADVNAKTKSTGCTPLFIAASNGQSKTAEALIFSGATLNDNNNFGKTPLYAAAEDGYYDIVKILLAAGADPNKPCLKDTPLHIAAANGHEEVVTLLIDYCADVNSLGEEQQSALHYAVVGGHTSVVRKLLNRGASVDVLDQTKETPLHKVSRAGQVSLIKLLLDSGARVNKKDRSKQTALHKVAEAGNNAVVAMLLRRGANVNVLDRSKETPLHKAAGKGLASMVELLINNGASVNISGKTRSTALHKAAAAGRTSVVALLLNKGAIINSTDKGGLTALHIAAEAGHEGVVSLLLQRGAFHSMKTVKDADTPYKLAVNKKRASVVALLESKGITQ